MVPRTKKKQASSLKEAISGNLEKEGPKKQGILKGRSKKDPKKNLWSV